MVKLKLMYLELREEILTVVKLKKERFLFKREGCLQLECVGSTNQNGFSLFGL